MNVSKEVIIPYAYKDLKSNIKRKKTPKNTVTE